MDYVRHMLLVLAGSVKRAVILIFFFMVLFTEC